MVVPRSRSANTTGTVASNGWEMVSSLIDGTLVVRGSPPLAALTATPTPIWAESIRIQFS